MKFNKGVTTSNSIEWTTPQYLFDELDKEFHFTLDPCATIENTKCKKYYTKETNGLVQDWSNEIVFMNPPYGSELKHWLKKGWEEAQKGAVVVCLIPSRTDTLYWHEYVMRGEIRFIRGRIKFGDQNNSAPFPSAYVIFRPPNNNHDYDNHD